MAQRLIEGEVEVVESPEVEGFREEIRYLRRELSESQRQTAQAKREATLALAGLRRQLSPLYKSLQVVFGELDAAGVEDEAPASGRSSNPRVSAVWEEWKTKLGSGTAAARVIDALNTHGELSVVQLKVAAKMAAQTVYDAIARLNKLGLVNKNGGRFSLKTL